MFCFTDWLITTIPS